MSDKPDVLVVSFPKSGRTWLRVFLSRYRQRLLALPEFDLSIHRTPGPKGVTYDFSHAGADPKFGFLRLRKLVMRNSDSRLLKLLPPWWYGIRDIAIPRGAGRYLFLVRDPRDVLVSYYHQARSRNRFWAGDMDSFARHRFIGIARIVELMNHLAACRDPLGAPFIYYEDLCGDPAGGFGALLEAAGDEVDTDLIREAVEYSSFERMRRMEQGGRHGKRLSARRKGDPNSLKTRKGGTGGYRDELPPATVDFIESYICEHLDTFYERYIYRTEGNDEGRTNRTY